MFPGLGWAVGIYGTWTLYRYLMFGDNLSIHAAQVSDAVAVAVDHVSEVVAKVQPVSRESGPPAQSAEGGSDAQDSSFSLWTVAKGVAVGVVVVGAGALAFTKYRAAAVAALESATSGAVALVTALATGDLTLNQLFQQQRAIASSFAVAILRGLETGRDDRKPLVEDKVAVEMFSLSKGPAPLVGRLTYSLLDKLLTTEGSAESQALVAPIRLLASPVKKGIDHVALRTAFFDEQVLKNSKCKQLVIFGSGLDARTFRLGSFLASEKIRTFEVDFPYILDRKRELFAHAGCEFDINYHGRVAFVGFDLSKGPDVMAEEFHQHGHEVATPTLWLLEGSTGRIQANKWQDVLETIDDLSAAGSVLVASWVGQRGLGKLSSENGATSKQPPTNALDELGWRAREALTFGDVMSAKMGSADSVDESVWFISQTKSA